MRKSRRQIANRVVETIALSVVVLDVAAFFGIYRYLGNKSATEARRHTELRQSIREEQVRVDLLKKFQVTLPQTAKDLEDFTANRIPPRRKAFSMAAHLVHEVGQAAGVEVLGTAYHLDSAQHDPLERLDLEINAQGSYAGLLKFSHALETANDFILVRDFTFTPGDNGALSLRLGADLYLTP